MSAYDFFHRPVSDFAFSGLIFEKHLILDEGIMDLISFLFFPFLFVFFFLISRTTENTIFA